MSSKISINFTETVSESIFIPIIVKAKETNRVDAILNDPKSVEIIQMVDIDTSRYEGGSIAHHGILTRTTILDKAVNDFVKANPEAIIINLGAGLDTRINRVDNGKLTWYDIDFPDVIELRKMFFAESDRVKFVAKSILDPLWANEINIEPNKPILILAEGLLMYFTEEELKLIFTTIINNFPNSEMYFDVVHSFFVGKGISSKFNWGIDKAKDIERLNSKIKLIDRWSVGNYHKKRQELFFRIMNVLPSTRNTSQILHISFT